MNKNITSTFFNFIDIQNFYINYPFKDNEKISENKNFEYRFIQWISLVNSNKKNFNQLNDFNSFIYENIKTCSKEIRNNLLDNGIKSFLNNNFIYIFSELDKIYDFLLNKTVYDNNLLKKSSNYLKYYFRAKYVDIYCRTFNLFDQLTYLKVCMNPRNDDDENFINLIKSKKIENLNKEKLNTWLRKISFNKFEKWDCATQIKDSKFYEIISYLRNKLVHTSNWFIDFEFLSKQWCFNLIPMFVFILSLIQNLDQISIESK